MNCKDCIHCELCDMYSKFGITDVNEYDTTICELFKDKSKPIELPDDYHRKVYIKHEGKGYFPYSVIRSAVYTEKWLCVSKEEAEQLLKELNK